MGRETIAGGSNGASAGGDGSQHRLATLAVLLAFIACGCAAAPPKPLVAKANAPAAATAGVTCKMDHVTGSLLPVQVCTTQNQRDTAHRSVQDYNDAINRSGNPPCIPGKTACQ